MSKEIYISSTPHETRLAIVEKDELTEIYYERENEYTLAGSIYNGRVTRVLPGMQSSFVDIGLERDAFLYITDFMEEAAEGADFEGVGGGDRAPRGERPAVVEGRSEVRSSEGRSSEGRSSEGRSSEGRSSEGRGEGRSSEGRGRRDGRGDRDRGRGRRDGRSEDRGPREERGGQGVLGSEATVVLGGGFDEPETFATYAPTERIDEVFEATPRVGGEDENLGEGAPGADGSRRWRGRRGRRRGRGVSGETRTESGAEGESNDSLGFAGVETSSEPEARESFAPRETFAARDAAPRETVAPREGGERAPRGDRGDRGGRDRGGRDGRRGGRDRDRGGDRGERQAEAPRQDAGRLDAVRERFAPRGPRFSTGENETVELQASVPAVEPFILPGESLSKYRRNEDGSPVEQSVKAPIANLVVAKPSSEVVPLAGWDGGAVLPGETIRRREPAGETRGEDRGGRDGRRDRDDRGGRDRGGRGERGRDDRGRDDRGRGGDRAPRSEFSASPQPKMDPAEAVLPGVTSGHSTEEEIQPVGHLISDDVAGFVGGLSDEPMVESFDEPQVEQQDFKQQQHEVEFHEAVQEMQAELKADAVHEAAEAAPEAHQAEAEAHQAEPEAHQAEPEVAEVHEFHEETAEYEPEEDASASFRVDPAGAREFRQGSPVEDEAEDFAAAAEEEVGGHQLTTVQAAGEMVTEVVDVEPSEPVEHEAVPVAHEHVAPALETTPYAETAQGFAPGDGQLEEELLDDEDGEVGGMQASGFDEDTEEVVLENAADLGSMIEDMTIDDITRSEMVELDEDDDEDFEDEEDFEEDELASTGESEFEGDELSGSDVSEVEEEEFAESGNYDENGEAMPRETVSADGERAPREGQRDGRRGRRDGRRGGRSGERSTSGERSGGDRGGERSGEQRSGERSGERSGDRSSRDRRGMAGSRSGGRGYDRGSGGRPSMQATNLPAISDLLKPGQEVLVQIAKEPIAKKGARITSHIALPGRFLVFMPTVSHVGVSRKIESDGERRRLKEILLSERGDATGGFIVRTAASGASEEELRSDLRFLLNLWADIKTRSESSKSPALIYHDLNLIERILRDQVTDNFSAIWVDTETEYERILRFLQRFQPNLIRRVKLYTKDTPLFEQFGITEEINKALRSKVWLKSGGSIVINQTEALVAIDINTGKYVGKTARLEDTIVKTNLDAIPEIVRQIRLRDLGGIIIIDFIDMDERKNRNKVMAALEDELKKDRAPSKVLQFNDFGLVAITRKRVKQSLERTLSTTCSICQGTGMVKSPVTVCNDLYIEMRKMHKNLDKGDIMLRVHPEVVKQLKTGGGKWLQEMEEMSGKTILVKSDPSLHPEQFDIH